MSNSFPSFSINDNDWIRVRQFVQRVSSHDLQGRGNLLPYTGAIDNVNLGSNSFSTTGAAATGTLTVSSTLVLTSGSMTDTTGNISFGNENLSTTGTLSSGTHTIGSLVLAAASITDTTGTIDFSDEHIKTMGDFTSPKGTGTIWGNESFGRNSLLSVTTGDYNTAIGSRALEALTIGHSNTAVGRKAGVSLTEGAYNIAIGLQALQNATTANQNVAIGTNALLAATSGYSNFACGYYAVDSLTEGIHNVGLGSEALATITTQNYNTAVGSHALGSITAAECTAIGYYAGKTCGAYSVSVGNFAGYVIGTNSVSIGSRAGYTTTLNNNVFIGHEAGRLNEGAGNVFVGYQAGRTETGSNKLYIQNSDSTTPLLCGDFNAPSLTINGLFNIGRSGVATDYDVNFYGHHDGTYDYMLHWDATNASMWIGRSDNSIGGTFNFVSGLGNTLLLNYNIVSGFSHNVNGNYNAVFGRGHPITSNYALVGGYVNTINGQYAFAAGRNNTASYCAGAMGRANVAGGNYSFAAGYSNSSAGEYSVSLGLNNNAGYTASVMIGNNNTATGNYAYGVGNGNFSGYNGVSIGYINVASANFSVALGRSNTTSGESAVAIGHTAIASGVSAIAIGASVTSSGQRAIVIGGNITNSITDSILLGITNSLFFGTASSIRLNDAGADIDVVVEGDTDTDLVHTDASTDRVGIGMAAPLYKLHVTGEVAVTTNSITLLISEDEITSSSGSVYFGDENLRTTGTGTFNSLIITAPTNTNYLFTTRSTSNTLALQSTVSGNKCTLELYSKDGDGSDEICYRMFAKGTPESITTYENIDFRYASNIPGFILRSNAAGTGTVLPIILYTGANTHQLVLATDGKVGINTDTPDSQFEVAGESRFGASSTNYAQFAADGELALVGTARTKNVLWLETGAIKAPGTKPATYIASGITGAWQFANAIAGNEETISGDMRVPRRMDRTAAPIISVGWSADGVSPGNCEWQLEYLWRAVDEDITAAAQETLTVVSIASTTANGLVIADFSGIDIPSATDACISFRIKRLSASANDTITDTVELHGICFEFITNKLGTPT